MQDITKDIEAVQVQYRELTALHAEVTGMEMQLKAMLAEAQRNLKAQLDDCQKLGFNPQTLPEDTRKALSVLEIKIANLKEDLLTVKRQLGTILKEVQ